jgi:hypothetical protein
LNFNWFDVPIMSGFVSMAVQCFFAWRVWILSQSVVLPVIIVLVRTFLRDYPFVYSGELTVSGLLVLVYAGRSCHCDWNQGGGSLSLANVMILTGILQQLKIIGSFAGVHTLYDVAIVWLVGSAVTDVIIAAAMTYFVSVLVKQVIRLRES